MARDIINEPIITIEENAVLKFDRLKGLAQRTLAKIEELQLDTIEATEENKALLKTTRTQFLKDFRELEDARKHIKSIIEQPYKEFLEVYNEEIIPYKDVDVLLKDKIDEIENTQRENKIQALEQFFEELKILHNRDLGTRINLNFLEFENLELHITLSASDNKLKEEIESKLLQFKNDLLVIRTHEHNARLFIIYQDKYNLSQALIELEAVLKRENEILDNAPKVEIKEPITNDVVVEAPIIEEVVEVSFRVIDTKNNIIKVRDFIRENGINYETIK